MGRVEIVNIGDKLKITPSTRLSEDRIYTPLPCTVVYIHPERRFYTVEFKSEVTGQTFRESFLYHDREWRGLGKSSAKIVCAQTVSCRPA